jgi:hypothetical protein
MPDEMLRRVERDCETREPQNSGKRDVYVGPPRRGGSRKTMRRG